MAPITPADILATIFFISSHILYLNMLNMTRNPNTPSCPR